jgi:hypothetical protein
MSNNIDPDEMCEVPSAALAEYAMWEALEGDTHWEVPSHDGFKREDLYDGVRLANVTAVEMFGREVTVYGVFDAPEVVDYVRGTWWDPPAVKTEDRKLFFSVEVPLCGERSIEDDPTVRVEIA